MMKKTKKAKQPQQRELQWSDLSRAELEAMLDRDEIEALVDSGEVSSYMLHN